MSHLVQKQQYLLKWKSIKPNGQIHNMIVLKGEFIKYFNNEYCEQFNNYKLGDEEPPDELIGTLLTEDEQDIEYPFDDPLYPYSRFYKQPFSNGCNLGLFKITSIENSVFKGTQRPYIGNNPYKFVTLYFNTLINTPPRIIYNETLMWVDLDKVEIRPVINKLKLLQEKAIDTLSLPTDITNYKIKTALGGKKTRKNKKRNKPYAYKKSVKIVKRKHKTTQKRRGFK